MCSSSSDYILSPTAVEATPASSSGSLSSAQPTPHVLCRTNTQTMFSFPHLCSGDLEIRQLFGRDFVIRTRANYHYATLVLAAGLGIRMTAVHAMDRHARVKTSADEQVFSFFQLGCSSTKSHRFHFGLNARISACLGSWTSLR